MRRTLQTILFALIATIVPATAWAQEESSATVEAKWGTSAESLTNSGTLADAIAAATADGSTVAYIQLQSSITPAPGYDIKSQCNFTLDLNGCTIQVTDEHPLYINHADAELTITDTSTDKNGKITSNSNNPDLIYPPVRVDFGKNLTIKGGTYETANDAVLFVVNDNCNTTITGGTFTNNNNTRCAEVHGPLNITGGTFNSYITVHNNTTIQGATFTNEDANYHIDYYGGTLDLSKYGTGITNISVYNNINSKDVDILLPSGYCFYDGSEATDILSINSYSIDAEPETKYTISYDANGGTGTMSAAVSYGRHLLPKCTITAPANKMFKAWQVGDTEYQPEDIITVTANTTVKALWKDYVPQLTIKMHDEYTDGWNNAVMTIKKNGEQIATATINDGNNEGELSIDYAPTAQYTFYWTKGDYDSECSFEIYIEDEQKFAATTDDCSGYSDGQLIHTITPLPIAEFTITDGTTTEYTRGANVITSTLTYTRTLPNTQWNALYVPFEIPLTEEFLTNYDVAYMNNIHAYDTDDNGTIDKLEMEVIKIKEGTLNANHPYFIRAKSDAAKSLTLTYTDAKLYAATATTLSCQSVYTKFDITGTYSPIDATGFSTIAGDKHYAISTDGDWAPIADDATLSPFRIYMTLTTLDGSPVKVAASANTISIRAVGESGDDNTTAIHEAKEQGTLGTTIHDLQGRQITEITEPGIYIINGKKVLIK